MPVTPSEPAGASAPPVGRLAPSPTGSLHIGHARSFLLAWWSIRSRGGRVVLRIDDLDGERVKPGMADGCRSDLEWLGLDWDGEPLVQSTDLAPYDEAIERLLADGRAYPCVCSRREVREALSAPHEGAEARYAGTCRGRWATPEEAESATGRTAGIRFVVEDRVLELEDAHHGSFRSHPFAECGDLLIGRRDGAPAYQLSVVVDDARQGVTEVLRGDDLLASCGRQALLQEALGLPRPRWVHVPLVVNDEGVRLAKRSGGLTLASLRESGVDPRALVAWVARSAGMEAGQRVSPAELTDCFALERVPPEPVRFGAAELAALSP
jgi:glutamyl-tRNA synthetase